MRLSTPFLLLSWLGLLTGPVLGRPATSPLVARATPDQIKDGQKNNGIGEVAGNFFRNPGTYITAAVSGALAAAAVKAPGAFRWLKNPQAVASHPEWYKTFERYLDMSVEQRSRERDQTLFSIELSDEEKTEVSDCIWKKVSKPCSCHRHVP